MLHGGLDRTAAAVTEDDDEGHVQFGDGVLDAALDCHAGATHDIAGDADHEDIAHAYVEEDLRGDAGIGAADDDGGILAFGESAKPRDCAAVQWVVL